LPTTSSNALCTRVLSYMAPYSTTRQGLADIARHVIQRSSDPRLELHGTLQRSNVFVFKHLLSGTLQLNFSQFLPFTHINQALPPTTRSIARRAGAR